MLHKKKSRVRSLHYFLTWIYGFFYSFESNSLKANTSWELRAEFDFVTRVLLGRFDRLVANVCCLILITDFTFICIAEIVRKFFSLQKKEEKLCLTVLVYIILGVWGQILWLMLKEFKLLCSQREITFCYKD